MPRLVLATIEDVPTTLELQDWADGRWADVQRGGRFTLPDARYVNEVVPGQPGQTAFDSVEDVKPVRLHCRFWGVGTTAAARRVDFGANMSALLAILGQVGNVVELTAYPPNESLDTGETASIELQVLRTIDTTPLGGESATFDIEFQAVGDPPDWVLAP